MDFHSTRVFSMKKVDDIANFAGGMIINHRTYHNSLCRGKNKHQDTNYIMVQKAMSHVTLPGIRNLIPAPTLVD
jgi:hypothetical protein